MHHSQLHIHATQPVGSGIKNLTKRKKQHLGWSRDGPVALPETAGSLHLAQLLSCPRRCAVSHLLGATWCLEEGGSTLFGVWVPHRVISGQERPWGGSSGISMDAAWPGLTFILLPPCCFILMGTSSHLSSAEFAVGLAVLVACRLFTSCTLSALVRFCTSMSLPSPRLLFITFASFRVLWSFPHAPCHSVTY